MVEANDGATDEERVSFDDVVEWYLVSPITLTTSPFFKRDIPGLGVVVSEWLESSLSEP